MGLGDELVENILVFGNLEAILHSDILGSLFLLDRLEQRRRWNKRRRGSVEHAYLWWILGKLVLKPDAFGINSGHSQAT